MMLFGILAISVSDILAVTVFAMLTPNDTSAILTCNYGI
jgi:hypothetical protein